MTQPSNPLPAGIRIQPMNRLLTCDEADEARDDTCERYVACLDYANENNWVSFRCLPNCPWYTPPDIRYGRRTYQPFFRRAGWHDLTESLVK
ncbi:MAG: hypothetical protein HQL60_08815 [Magnetococcales bacterium]|nr:hypothetical protein [Magnetococcales bacterium]